MSRPSAKSLDDVRRLSPVRVVGIFAVLWVAVPAMWSPRADAATSGRYLNPVFTSVTKTSNITYGRAPNSTTGAVDTLKLDLYQPSGDTATKRPVVVFAHGGAFTGGDKVGAPWLIVAQGLARRGYIVASINYRLTGSATDATHDMLAAVRFFRRYASTYRADPNHVVVMGSSSGAEMALKATYNFEDAGTSGNPGYSSRPSGGVAVSWSQLTGIDAGDPPVAAFTSIGDAVNPYPEAQGMCAVAQAQGDVCVLNSYVGTEHGQALITAHAAEVLQQTADFLCRQVLGPVICKAP